MKTNLWTVVAVAMASTFSAACTTDVVDSVEGVEDISASEGALRILNGDRLSGVSLSGISVNGAYLNGVHLDGMTLGGLALSNVSLSGTSISATLPSGVVISGTELVGAMMSGSMSDGSQLTLRIDDIRESDTDAEILHYKISFAQPNGTYASICGTSVDGAQVQAFPLAGRWDHTEGTPTGGSHIDDAGRFTLACRGAAIAKCAEAGYKPWKSQEECNSLGDCQHVSLAEVHQACVRMVRADYCGDGSSHTVVGTEIDMFDAFGMKTEDSVSWNLEAEWTTDGAQCVLHTRWVSASHGDVEQYMQTHCPSRLTPIGSGVDCGRESSTFFTENGFSTSLESRVLFRNKSEVHQ